MKILINENQLILLAEASKEDILINKQGFEPNDAKKLVDLTGALSVWFGKLIIDRIKATSRSNEADFKNFLSKGNVVDYYRNDITNLMDWIRVGLNGNVKPYMNLNFRDLLGKSKEWHDSLGVGGGAINYKEENLIVRDYRKNGVGFYWADLQTDSSDEECNRMGHCGRTSAGETLYSLREVVVINPKYTVNKSHLTAAIGSDGIIYQMKGQKNSKPAEKYFPYIIDLLLNDKHLSGFGSEYEGAKDFSILDLPKDDISKIYQNRPELFNDRKSKKALKSIGFDVDLPERDKFYYLEIDPDSLHYYLDDDYVVRGNHKNRNEVYLSKEILTGEDIYSIFEDSYYGEWESALEYDINDDNTKYIWDIIKKIAEKRDFDITGMDLKDAIEELDEDNEIRYAISTSNGDAGIDALYLAYREKLKDALSEYGEVTRFEYNGVEIKVDLLNYGRSLGFGEDEIDEMYDRCEDELHCVFNELIESQYDKPSFRLDDRFVPDINKDYFNSVLNDRLGEIRV